jgi:hypothetical protein
VGGVQLSARSINRNVAMRQVVAVLLLAFTAIALRSEAALASDHVINVQPGESIQGAVDQARPGDKVVVLPGNYREAVIIRTDQIALEGFGATLQPPESPTQPGCLGESTAPEFGICVVGQLSPGLAVVRPVVGVRITGFTVSGFAVSGIEVFGGMKTKIAHTETTHNGSYGILSELSQDTLIARNRTSGNEEAGIYIGSSPEAHATVVHNASVADGELGIFIRNSSHGVVSMNSMTGDCVGIGVLDIPAERLDPAVTPLPPSDWDVRWNVITDNTQFCSDTPPLSGTGVLLTGVHDTVVRGNLVVGNAAFPGLESPLAGGIVAGPTGTFGSRPSADDVIVNNVARGNRPFDLIRFPDAGEDLRFVRNLCETSSPVGLCGGFGWIPRPSGMRAHG